MRSWVILLGVAAGFGPVAEEAFADRGRRSHSSAQQPRYHHQQSRPQHHHARPQLHHHSRPHGYHHRYWRSPGIVVAPAFGAFYAAPGYFYAPPLVEAPPVVAAPPVVHPSNGDGYWYFCSDSRAYYPYVLECPSNWLRVLPN